MELKQLDTLFNSELKSKKIGGAAIHIEQHGKVLFENYYGSDRPGDIYKIYSMTKPITAVAIMILFERGLISLEEPVAKFLPIFNEMTVNTERGIIKAQKSVTIQHLLNMTSGIIYPNPDGDLPEQEMHRLQQEMKQRVANGEKLDTRKICDILATVPLRFEPGTRWCYGASADFLAAIVEVITGLKYSDFLQKEIFTPLEMVDTAFTVPKEKLPRMARMYSRDPNTAECGEPDAGCIEWLGLTNPAKEPNIESGGGGLYSTLNDYIHFARMLLNKGTYLGKNGEIRILSRKTVEFMAQSGITEDQKKPYYFDSITGYGYGNLLRVMTNTMEAASNGSLGEFGWDGLAGTYFMIDPVEDLMLVYMQQIAQGSDNKLRQKYRQIVYSSIE